MFGPKFPTFYFSIHLSLRNQFTVVPVRVSDCVISISISNYSKALLRWRASRKILLINVTFSHMIHTAMSKMPAQGSNKYGFELGRLTHELLKSHLCFLVNRCLVGKKKS